MKKDVSDESRGLICPYWLFLRSVNFLRFVPTRGWASPSSQNFFEPDGHPYVARRRNMLERALAVLLVWTLAVQQGLCGKLEKIAQQPNNVLVDYYAYRHISIIHFNVPELSVAVAFKYV